MPGIQRRLRRAGAAAVLLAALSVTASAAPRVALVIGNAAYEHTTPLRNSRNDAADMASALRAVGFEVIEGLDLDKSGFEEKLYEFAAAAQGAEATLFFYAGHGLQVDGENYLVPTDARLMREIDLRLRTFELTAFTDEMRGATNMVFLDACRDNPLARSLVRSMGATRSAAVGRGLGRVDSTSGTLIAYATQPGNVAGDGAGRNSPFTEALLAHLATPGQSVNDLMTVVTGAVMSATGGRQQPWVHSSLPHTFHFVSGTAPDSATETAADTEDTTSERLRAERLAADRALIRSNVEVLNGVIANLSEKQTAYFEVESNLRSEGEDTAALRQQIRKISERMELLVEYRNALEDALEEEKERLELERLTEPEAAAHELSLALARVDRILVQRALALLGFSVGAADGKFDSRTRAAIRAFQETRGTPVTSFLTRKEFEALSAIVD